MDFFCSCFPAFFCCFMREDLTCKSRIRKFIKNLRPIFGCVLECILLTDSDAVAKLVFMSHSTTSSTPTSSPPFPGALVLFDWSVLCNSFQGWA